MNPPRWWRRESAFAALLVLAAFAVYLPVWRAGFVWDDEDNIINNMVLRSLDGLRRIWLEFGVTAQYYPLTHTSFWLEYQLWGLHPFGYHLVNVLLHACNALLFWRVLRALGVPGARLAASIFLLHPVGVESVAWVTERKNTLAAVFYLGSLLAAVRFWRLGEAGPVDTPAADGRHGPQKYYWLTLALYVCALWSKTATVPLPAVLLLLIWWKHGRLAWRVLWPMLPFFMAGLALGLITMGMERYYVGTINTRWDFSPAQHVLIAGRALWFYLGKLLWPHPLIVVYPRWTIDPASLRQWLAPLAAAAGLFALWRARHGRARPAFVAAVYFVLLLFPVLGFFNVYYFQHAFVSDHFQYFAALGPLALVAAGLTRGFRFLCKKTSRLPVALAGALLLTLGTLTWQQTAAYADDETLWRATIVRNPQCWVAYNNLGKILTDRKQITEAAWCFQKAIEANPKHWMAYNNLGKIFADRKQITEAIRCFQKAIEANPDDAVGHFNLAVVLLLQNQTDAALDQTRRALMIRANYPDAIVNLGNILFKQNRVDEAIVQYRLGLSLQPDSADAHYNLGNALVRQGRAAEAITQFAEAIRLFPDNATFQCALASSLTEQGETDAALPHYETALALEPDNADAHYNLGGALLTKGPGGLAVASAHFQRAIELRPDDDGANASLGDCFYLAGRTDKAVAQWEKALALNPRRMSTSANLAWVLATSQEIPSRNGFKAVGLAEQAIRVGGGTNPIMLRALAAAYAEASRFPEAVASARQAAQLALAEGNTALVAELQEQLRLYQAGQPFRDTSSNATITIDVRLRRYQAGQPYHDPGP